jgi:DNA-binding transcriptional LysR family regulator
MNTKKINLNFLQALDALLTERNVTRAAERLYVSQSAMSNTLNQLRDVFEDDLLVRGKRCMELTPKAKSLQSDLHHHIEALQQLVVQAPMFNPAESTQVFNIAMADVVALTLLPPLVKHLYDIAPNIQLKIRHLDYVDTERPFVEDGIDIAMALQIKSTPHLNSEYAFETMSSIIAHKSHRIFSKKITLASFLKEKHIRIQYFQGPKHKTKLDTKLESLGKKRDIYLTLTDLIPAFRTLGQTDLIASIPMRFSDTFLNKFNLKAHPMPFQLDTRPIQTIWLRQNDNDPGLMWLREMIQSVIASRQFQSL